MSAPESNWRDWITRAANDWLNIENNLNSPRVPLDTVSYHAHQVAEKSLKGFLVYHRKRLRKTHDLAVLLEDCAAIDGQLYTLKSDCDGLTKQYIDTRYPGGGELNEQAARWAIGAATRIRDEVQSRLPSERD